MTNNFKNWLLGVLVTLFMIGVGLFGFYTYPKVHPCPVFTSSHTVVYDTAKKHIYHIWPWYILGKDSIIYNDVPADIDTAEILKDYYATHQYEREISDSNLTLKWTDAISQNKPMVVDGFDYKFIRPTNIINNVLNQTNYSKYFYIGGSFVIPDVKYSNVGVFYAFPAGLIGLGYIPFQKGMQVTTAYKFIKLR